MTTREIYFQIYMQTSKPMGMFFYTVIENELKNIGNTKWMILNEEHHEINIEYMMEIEKQHANQNFYWNASDEFKNKIIKAVKKNNDDEIVHNYDAEIIKSILMTLTFLEK